MASIFKASGASAIGLNLSAAMWVKKGYSPNDIFRSSV